MIKHKTKKNKKPNIFFRHLRGSGNKTGGTKRKRSSSQSSSSNSSSSNSSSSKTSSSNSSSSSQKSNSLKKLQKKYLERLKKRLLQKNISKSDKRKITNKIKKIETKNKMSLKKRTVKNKSGMRKTPNININVELYKQIQSNGGLLQLLLDMIGTSYNLAIFSGFLQEGSNFPYENHDGTKLYENKQSRNTDTDPYICESGGRVRCGTCNLPPNFEEGLLFDGAHWKGYRKKKGSTVVFDSYGRNLQVKGTNNYCQSFATFLWTSEGNHNKKHNITLVENQYSKNIQQISCLWKKLFTEIKSNYIHYMWYIGKLNNDIDLPYLKKSENKNSTIIFDIVLRILQELCKNQELARKFSNMRESNDSEELHELKAIFNL